MNDGRSKVNISLGPTAADVRRTKKGLARLRAAIQNKDFWIIATDDERTSHACHVLVGLLVANGTPADDLVLANLDFTLRHQALPLPLTICALSKQSLSAEDIAHFISRLTGCGTPDRIELAALIRSGRDLFPLGSDPDLITRAIDGLATGQVFELVPGSN